jgi:predicted RNA binding protein YcfA (HicA-like mRNA interferase family)
MKGYGYTPDKFIKILIKNGWKFSHCKSNHYTYEKENTKSIITVPTHKQELSRPIVAKLLKMAGIKA